MAAWANAVSEHPEINSEFAECLDALRESNYDRAASEGAFNWIKKRRSPMWRKAPSLPEYTLDQVLQISIANGVWTGYLLPQLALSRIRRVLVDVFDDAEKLAPAWQEPQAPAWSDYSRSNVFPPPHPAIVLHLYPGVTLKEARAVLSYEWHRVQGKIGKAFGTRNAYHPKDYATDLELYKAWLGWKAKHRKGSKTFARAHRHPDPAIGWQISAWPEWTDITADGIAKRLGCARRWLDPAPAMRMSLTDYLHTTPGDGTPAVSSPR
jgi:hypothetical protein